MAQPKLKFHFAAPANGGHSLLKIVAFDFRGQSMPLEKRYTFNGRFAPLSKKPQLHEKASDVEKGVWADYNVALDWAKRLWAELDKTNIAHGFIADANFGIPNFGGRIWQQYEVAKMSAIAPQPYLFCLRVKLASGKYWECRTIGQVDSDTAELDQNWESCLADLQTQYNRFATHNPQSAATAQKGFVFGDGKTLHTDTRNFQLYRIDFNPQTMQFFSRRRSTVLAIQAAERV